MARRILGSALLPIAIAMTATSPRSDVDWGDEEDLSLFDEEVAARSSDEYHPITIDGLWRLHRGHDPESLSPSLTLPVRELDQEGETRGARAFDMERDLWSGMRSDQ